MKFDKVISNPPYDKNLHLKIVSKILDNLTEEGTLINLAPNAWFADNYAKYKKHSDWNEYKHLFKNLEGYENIGNIKEHFIDTSYGSDLCIYTYKGKETNFNISNLQNNKILDKVVGYCLIPGNSLEDHMCKDIDGNIVYVNRIYGGDWHNGGIIKDYKFRYEGNSLKKFITGNNGTIKFETEEEAKNFSDSAKTTFYSYLLSLHGPSIRWNTKYFPFMQDYKEPWTNERFYAYFNITKEEQKLIETTLIEG